MCRKNKKHYALLIFIFVLLFMPSIAAHAEDIHLSHTLTGVTEGTDTATINLTLHVENTGTGVLNNLILTCDLLRIISVDKMAVDLANIEPGQTINVPITFVTTLPFDQTIIGQEPIFCGGEFKNADGSRTIVEFPAPSYHIGGAL